MLKKIKGWFTNNIFYKIISVVFAFLIWMVIVNMIDPDTTKTISDIPVVIQNEEAVMDGSHVYRITSGESASITISGSRSVINSLSASDFNAVADFSEMSLTGAVPITVSLTTANIKYNNKISIETNTTSMVLDVENISDTVRMIEIEYEGELASDLVIDDIKIDPESVTITAPESVLSDISRAGIVIDYSQIESTGYIYADPIIYDENGNEIENELVSVDCDTVAIYVEVSHVKQIPINFTVGGEPADGYEITAINASAEYVNIKGSELSVGKVSGIEIGAEILDVTGRDSSLTIIVDLTVYLPDDVELYGESSTVTVSVVITKSGREG